MGNRPFSGCHNNSWSHNKAVPFFRAVINYLPISFSLTRTPTTDVLLNSKITQIHTHAREQAHTYLLIARTHLFNSLKKNTLKTRTRYGTIASHKSNAFSKLVKTTSDFPSRPPYCHVQENT